MELIRAILLVCDGAFLMQSMSGLETSFFTLLLLTSLPIYAIALNKKWQDYTILYVYQWH